MSATCRNRSRIGPWLIAVALLLLLGQPAHAGVVFSWTTYPNYNVKTVISGTNNLSEATVGTEPGTFLMSDRLFIQGVKVKENTFTYFQQVRHHTVTVVWDSTEFQDGTVVTVKAEGTDSAGNTSTSTYTTTVYNKALILGNTGEPLITMASNEAMPHADANLATMKHSRLPSVEMRKPMILQEIPIYTVLAFTLTHGGANPSVFGDCKALTSSDTSGFYIRNTEVTAVNKTAAQPPYNYVFMFACLTAKNDLMAGAFGINATSINRAYLGFATEASMTTKNVNWAKTVWQYLAAGETIGDAVAKTKETFGAPENRGAEAITAIHGDKTMKLHGVYGGVGTKWFR